MKLQHWMKKENSGLARTTLELVKYEERAGHKVCIRQPSESSPMYGSITEPDIHLIHSQLAPETYHDRKPKVMWMHGEPLSSVGNGVSMKAIVDLAPICDAFVCMREDEHAIWSAIRRTHLVPKGIDLEVFKPADEVVEKLPGDPAILYFENWRGERNPLYLVIAMIEVHKRLPGARLHLYNVQSKKMLDAFKALNSHCKLWPFLRSIQGPVEDVNQLLNRVDIVVSGLYPLYARGIEAFGAGRAFIGAGYREHRYPWTCELDPKSMADAIVKCWENYDRVDYRKWAEEHHDVRETVRQSIEIYERYV